MDLANYSIFGNQPNTSAIPSGMLNTNADGSTDWNAVLANGIRGAAQAAISASVGEKFESGQLVAQAQATARNVQTRNLLIVGALAYFFLRS